MCPEGHYIEDLCICVDATAASTSDCAASDPAGNIVGHPLINRWDMFSSEAKYSISGNPSTQLKRFSRNREYYCLTVALLILDTEIDLMIWVRYLLSSVSKY